MSDLNVYTTSQINALTPITGDMVVDSDLNAVKLYDGSAWRTWNSDSTAVPFNNEWGAAFSSDYLEPASNPNLDIYSMSLWFKPSTTITSSSVGTLVGGVETVYTGIRLGMGAGRTLEYHGSVGYIAAGNTSTIDTNWHNLIMVYVGSGYTTTLGNATNNGVGYKLFLDGSRVDTTLKGPSYNFALATTTAKFKLGREGERSQYYYNGLMDEFAIFGSSLSDSEVSAIYNGGAPVDLGADGLNLSPDMYCRMGDDSNDSPSAGGNISSISDSSGNGHHLTNSTASRQPTFSDLTGETIYS